MKQIKFSLIIVLSFISLFFVNSVMAAESGSITVNIPSNFTSGSVSVRVNGTDANGNSLSKTITYNLSSNVVPVNGTCGSDNGQSFYSLANGSATACSAGTEANFATTGGTNPGWTWNCNGSNGGTNASCSANKKVDGVCGTDCGQNLYTAPTNLCSAGNASAVTTTGGTNPGWTWTCYGINGGVNVSGFANKKVDGVCGAVVNTCTAGNFVDTADGACTNNWTCAGINNGTSAVCLINKADGTSCNDGNSCTSPDTCTSGVCGGPNICGIADLITQNLNVSGILTAGNTLSFSATVKNSGLASAGAASQTRLRIDQDRNGTWDVSPGNQSTSNLAVNATETETWSNAWVNVPAGNHRMEVCADVTNTVAESSEFNNCSTYDFVVNTSVPIITLSPTTMTFSAVSGGSAPAAQNLTITNTGDVGSQLNWRAQTNQNWCRVNGVNNSGSITGGPLAKNSSSTVSVTVDAPSNTGTFNCIITVSDVSAVAASKTATVTYTVRPGDPGGGNSANVTASNAICEKISLSWTAGVGASSYNVYRNTVNSAPATPYASGITATTYTDNSPTPIGTRFYYWVESVGGGLTSPNKVAANTNASGGIAANLCNPPPNGNPGPGPVYNSSTDPLTVTAGGAACNQVRITWTDNSTNETGFKIFRGTTSNSSAAVLVQTVAANTSSFLYSPPDTNPYYYFVAATNAGGDSTRVAATSNPVAAIACQANLVGSDKDIVAVNASSFTTNSCGSTDPLPSYVSLKRGDKLKFSVNVCNTQGENSATNIIITDNLINLKRPATGWNARFNGNLVNPTVSGSEPNQTLVFDLSAFPVPAGSIYSLTFEAEIDVPAGYAGSTSRLQNSVTISYRRDPASQTLTTVNFATPLLLFNVRSGTPSIIETSP